MGKVIQGSRVTPHGIEDILRGERRTVNGGDSERDRYQDTDRDSVGPLNLSKYFHTETVRDNMGEDNTKRETDCGNTKTEKILPRKKMRTTFTGRQIFSLERMFETKKYLNAGERSNLSRYIGEIYNLIRLITMWA